MTRAVGPFIVVMCLGAAGFAQAPKPVAPAPAPAQQPPAPAPTTPATPATPPATGGPPAAVPEQAPTPEAYTYAAEGRRDPFVSLLQRGADLRGPLNRPEGLSGLMIDEVRLTGTVRTMRGYIAMLVAPDNRTYIVRANDRLFDGAIKAITDAEVVFSQEVNDPLSLIKQREVRKPLRALQEGK